jgi:hypothetical protein
MGNHGYHPTATAGGYTGELWEYDKSASKRYEQSKAKHSMDQSQARNCLIRACDWSMLALIRLARNTLMHFVIVWASSEGSRPDPGLRVSAAASFSAYAAPKQWCRGS